MTLIFSQFQCVAGMVLCITGEQSSGLTNNKKKKIKFNFYYLNFAHQHSTKWPIGKAEWTNAKGSLAKARVSKCECLGLHYFPVFKK